MVPRLRVWHWSGHGESLSTLTRARWKEWMMDGPSGTLKEFPKTRSWYGWLAHPTSAEWKANDLFWDPGLTSLINSFIQSLIQPISRQTCTHTWERQISVPMNTFQVEEMKTLIGVYGFRNGNRESQEELLRQTVSPTLWNLHYHKSRDSPDPFYHFYLKQRGQCIFAVVKFITNLGGNKKCRLFPWGYYIHFFNVLVS